MDGNNSGSAEGPQRSRPFTQKEYGIPETQDEMLTWEFVTESMSTDRFFWITTIRPDGKPHARPTWGVWIDETFYCGGGERTRWVRNISTNPNITVHRENAEEVVIIEGTAERIDEDSAEPTLIKQIDKAYEKKYDMPHGTPFIAVQPEKVLAWSNFPIDATRWEFPNQ